MFKKGGICYDCEYRKRSCRHPNPYRTDTLCKYWKLGRCFICKNYKDGKLMTEEETDEWFKRGCECWFPTAKYCKHFRIDFKKVYYEYFKIDWKKLLKIKE